MRKDVQVWHASLDVDNSRLGALAASLSEDELARAARFHFTQDRQRWIASRGLLRTVLGHMLETPPQDFRFERGPFGKPYLRASPLSFNLSHTQNRVLIAAAWEREVGVDIEQTRSDFSPLELASQVFSLAEQRFLHSLSPPEQHQGFLRLWTAKEAYIKACGDGLSFPLDRLTLLPPPPGKRQWLVSDETARTAHSSFQVYSLAISPDCFSALAVEEVGTPVQRGTTIQEIPFNL